MKNKHSFHMMSILHKIHNILNLMIKNVLTELFYFINNLLCSCFDVLNKFEEGTPFIEKIIDIHITKHYIGLKYYKCILEY